MSEPHLAAENLHVWRGERHVLRGISFELRAGELLQVTGRNGSGKTTLLRAICGLIYAEEGRVLWSGHDVRSDMRAFHSSLGYLAHDVPLKTGLTIGENLVAWVGIRRSEPRAAIEDALATTSIRPLEQRLVRTLSAGQKRRAALAGLLALAVPLWVLDEPTTHLDSEGLELIGTLLTAHAANGGCSVVASHQPISAAGCVVQRLELS